MTNENDYQNEYYEHDTARYSYENEHEYEHEHEHDNGYHYDYEYDDPQYGYPRDNHNHNHNHNRKHKLSISESAPRDLSLLPAFATGALSIQTLSPDSFLLRTEQIDGFPDVSAHTASDIFAGSTVLFVPAASVLSAYDVKYELSSYITVEQVQDRLLEIDFRPDPAQQKKRNLMWKQFFLVLKLLAEHQKGTDSPWYPYLASLPRYFSNGPSMTPFCYNCIPSYLTELCQRERATMNQLLLLKPLAENLPDEWLDDETRGNADLWKWAYQIVLTRAVSSSHDGDDDDDEHGDLRLVPLADMINHSHEPNVEILHDDYGNVHVQTLRDVPADSPLCRSYGNPADPSRLLARYGFFDEDYPWSFCKLLPPNHVSDELLDLGYDPGRLLFDKNTGEISEEVWDVLLYLALGDGDACDDDGGATQRRFYEAHVRGDYEEKARIHGEWYAHTLAALAEHVEKVLGELEVLEEKGIYGGRVAGEDHPRLPLILRHNRYVRETFLAVKDRFFKEDEQEEEE
ncbi:hypothetical protein ACHAXS_007592 [Conticribra weissflogii]